MNWLAHFYLSEPTPAFRVGNILPDLLSLQELGALPSAYQRGIACHWRIDAFTDSHPIVRRSIARVSPRFRRFAGVLTDVFYDHYLARDWHQYADVTLESFAAQVYRDFEACRFEVPMPAFARLERMQVENWLLSYREPDGVAVALARIEARLKRPFPLSHAISELQAHDEAWRADFAEFFPQLRAHVAEVYEL